MIVLYHANCSDGFCAAWLLHSIYPEAKFIPVNYDEKPPKIDNEIVFIVDFSYKLPEMNEIYNFCKQLIVLDHHKTAQKELSSFSGPKALVIFDMNKSGGRLTWEFLNPDKESPWLVDYTEDRDLWRFKLPNSREINAALRSYPFDFDTWDTLDPDNLVKEGQAILRYQKSVVDSHVKNAYEIDLDGYKVLAVNATTMISEIAGELALRCSFGVCYFDQADGKRIYSLRSTDEGIDVSEIAKKHGGGGHRNAAGFVERINK